SAPPLGTTCWAASTRRRPTAWTTSATCVAWWTFWARCITRRWPFSIRWSSGAAPSRALRALRA
ncbi:unnamed protein product, partial [Effrenium voratum]